MKIDLIIVVTSNLLRWLRNALCIRAPNTPVVIHVHHVERKGCACERPGVADVMGVLSFSRRVPSCMTITKARYSSKSMVPLEFVSMASAGSEHLQISEAETHIEHEVGEREEVSLLGALLLARLTEEAEALGELLAIEQSVPVGVRAPR